MYSSQAENVNHVITCHFKYVSADMLTSSYFLVQFRVTFQLIHLNGPDTSHCFVLDCTLFLYLELLICHKHLKCQYLLHLQLTKIK